MRKIGNVKHDTLYKYYSSIEDDYEKKWTKKDFESFILNQYNIFILSHPEPVGYIKARIINNEMEIISILVDKKFKKKGIGKNLLKKLLNLAKKKKNSAYFFRGLCGEQNSYKFI